AVFAGFQNTAACGVVAWNPDPLVVNLMAPAASGSDALVLRSARTFQPLGACAINGAVASSASAARAIKRFIGLPPVVDWCALSSGLVCPAPRPLDRCLRCWC